MTPVTWPTVEAERVAVFEPVAPARLPLFPEMPAAEPYPVGALGPVLGPAALAISHKVQVPEAIAAQSVLAAASLVAQAHDHNRFDALAAMQVELQKQVSYRFTPQLVATVRMHVVSRQYPESFSLMMFPETLKPLVDCRCAACG